MSLFAVKSCSLWYPDNGLDFYLKANKINGFFLSEFTFLLELLICRIGVLRDSSNYKQLITNYN